MLLICLSWKVKKTFTASSRVSDIKEGLSRCLLLISFSEIMLVFKLKDKILCSTQYKENMTNCKNLQPSSSQKLEKHLGEDGNICITLSS